MNQVRETKFLIVDDFSTMRRIIHALLRELGYANAVEAEDGLMALHRLQIDPSITFVIADINMPNMNGFKLLDEIKKSEKLKNLPVLLITAEARKEDIIFAAKGGAAGYIIKPFTKSTLDIKIRKILETQEAVN